MMKMRAAILTAFALLAVSAASAWEIPLTVDNPARSGVPPYISGGVPLLAGQAKEATDLTLAVKGPDGKLAAIPAQFRVLARWWRGDNSIRWVLVDFPSSAVPGEKKVVYLTDAKLEAAAPKQTVKVEDKGETLVVSTGVAVFTVNKAKFNFLQSAVVDGEELLEGSPDLGTVIEDNLGGKYYASEGTKAVEVLEAGPVRVQIRARGQHKARDGKGYSRGYYGYDVFMNFYAGSSEVGADVILTNNFAKSIGEPLMKDASLVLKLAGGAQGCRLYGAAPKDLPLAAGESAAIYQDSNGAETWENCTGGIGKVTRFRGYRLLKRAGGKEDVVTQGDQARGTAHLYNDKGGVVLLMRNFWQQFPKTVETGADGTLRLGMFPRECASPHYLDDCAGKGHEIVLHFYAKGKSRYAADDAGRTWPHVLADAWDVPALPRPEIEHIAATGALTDLGPFVVPTRGFEDYDVGINIRRMLMSDKYYGNCIGWQVYGERWLSWGGHSTHGARQPIKEDDYLWRWYVTGGGGWLDAGINRARLFRDVRAYRIDDVDALSFKSWAEFKVANTSESREWTSRPIPKDEELAKYQAGIEWHARWEFPNPEHCTLDLLYDRYLLFGDQRAYENMRVVAGHGGYFAIAHAPAIHRNTGWSWRALERYWELTGDKRAKELLDQCIAAYSPLIGQTNLWFQAKEYQHEWFTMIFTRAAAMTALHTGDPKALDICRALASDKDGKADYFSTILAVLWHLTGEEKYKDPVLKKTNDGRKLLVVHDNDGFLPSAAWLLKQPAKGK
ncbi:MAG TPA: hypothetical protein PK280_03715 [Planctomycetota bacterium]|nr:hypothetical protein [Planctomycetota bacterium]